ncbi:hypothetical protein HMN09_01116000 [Mycena chlorophos]|uniref:Uncharacterized protein n=1 Tax=Mycena chlorophos TaxID=658473 RepID=A0A8H6SCC8_MYCCL|nr:hypothetical protein HMN09_01116000 [Mycena chlorophos]
MDMDTAGPGTLRSSPVSERKTEEDEQTIREDDGDGQMVRTPLSPTYLIHPHLCHPSLRAAAPPHSKISTTYNPSYTPSTPAPTSSCSTTSHSSSHKASTPTPGVPSLPGHTQTHAPFSNASSVVPPRPTGLLEFLLLKLQSALRATPHSHSQLPHHQRLASALNFLASPMPRVSLARHRALFLSISKGITTVAHLKCLAKRWDPYHEMFTSAHPKITPFESLVLEMGLERLREGPEA